MDDSTGMVDKCERDCDCACLQTSNVYLINLLVFCLWTPHLPRGDHTSMREALGSSLILL